MKFDAFCAGAIFQWFSDRMTATIGLTRIDCIAKVSVNWTAQESKEHAADPLRWP